MRIFLSFVSCAVLVGSVLGPLADAASVTSARSEVTSIAKARSITADTDSSMALSPADDPCLYCEDFVFLGVYQVDTNGAFFANLSVWGGEWGESGPAYEDYGPCPGDAIEVPDVPMDCTGGTTLMHYEPQDSDGPCKQCQGQGREQELLESIIEASAAADWTGLSGDALNRVEFNSKRGMVQVRGCRQQVIWQALVQLPPNLRRH